MDIEQYVKEHLPNALRSILKSKKIDVFPELNVYEKAIIFSYTDAVNNQHQFLNDMLWASQGKEISDFGQHLETCLAKLDSFEGLVYRGVKEEFCDIQRLSMHKKVKPF